MKVIRRRRDTSGFTLVEVLVAIAIIAVVALVLLYRRVEIVRDAGKIRDERVAWMLAAWKLGELSADPARILAAETGDFEESLPDQPGFRWSYTSEREEVRLDDTPAEKPAEILRVRLTILGPDDEELQKLEAMFPAPKGTP
jgi:type II secretion system protein I